MRNSDGVQDSAGPLTALHSKAARDSMTEHVAPTELWATRPDFGGYIELNKNADADGAASLPQDDSSLIWPSGWRGLYSARVTRRVVQWVWVLAVAFCFAGCKRRGASDGQADQFLRLMIV